MEWILSSERVPNDGSYIIILFKKVRWEDPATGYKLVRKESLQASSGYYSNGEFSDDTCCFEAEWKDVTLWMTLPDPPECNPGDPHCNKSPSSNG